MGKVELNGNGLRILHKLRLLKLIQEMAVDFDVRTIILSDKFSDQWIVVNLRMHSVVWVLVFKIDFDGGIELIQGDKLPQAGFVKFGQAHHTEFGEGFNRTVSTFCTLHAGEVSGLIVSKERFKFDQSVDQNVGILQIETSEFQANFLNGAGVALKKLGANVVNVHHPVEVRHDLTEWLSQKCERKILVSGKMGCKDRVANMA